MFNFLISFIFIKVFLNILKKFWKNINGLFQACHPKKQLFLEAVQSNVFSFLWLICDSVWKRSFHKLESNKAFHKKKSKTLTKRLCCSMAKKSPNLIIKCRPITNHRQKNPVWSACKTSILISADKKQFHSNESS